MPPTPLNLRQPRLSPEIDLNSPPPLAHNHAATPSVPVPIPILGYPRYSRYFDRAPPMTGDSTATSASPSFVQTPMASGPSSSRIRVVDPASPSPAETVVPTAEQIKCLPHAADLLGSATEVVPSSVRSVLTYREDSGSPAASLPSAPVPAADSSSRAHRTRARVAARRAEEAVETAVHHRSHSRHIFDPDPPGPSMAEQRQAAERGMIRPPPPYPPTRTIYQAPLHPDYVPTPAVFSFGRDEDDAPYYRDAPEPEMGSVSPRLASADRFQPVTGTLDRRHPRFAPPAVYGRPPPSRPADMSVLMAPSVWRRAEVPRAAPNVPPPQPAQRWGQTYGDERRSDLERPLFPGTERGEPRDRLVAWLGQQARQGVPAQAAMEGVTADSRAGRGLWPVHLPEWGAWIPASPDLLDDRDPPHAFEPPYRPSTAQHSGTSAPARYPQPFGPHSNQHIYDEPQSSPLLDMWNRSVQEAVDRRLPVEPQRDARMAEHIGEAYTPARLRELLQQPHAEDQRRADIAERFRIPGREVAQQRFEQSEEAVRRRYAAAAGPAGLSAAVWGDVPVDAALAEIEASEPRSAAHPFRPVPIPVVTNGYLHPGYAAYAQPGPSRDHNQNRGREPVAADNSFQYFDWTLYNHHTGEEWFNYAALTGRSVVARTHDRPLFSGFEAEVDDYWAHIRQMNGLPPAPPPRAPSHSLVFRDGQSEAEKRAVLLKVAKVVHRLGPMSRRIGAESKIGVWKWGDLKEEPKALEEQCKEEGMCAVCYENVSCFLIGAEAGRHEEELMSSMKTMRGYPLRRVGTYITRIVLM